VESCKLSYFNSFEFFDHTSDLYLAKWFALTERVKLRFDTQFFNVFNHPNFGLPSMVLAGIPGNPPTQTGFGALTYKASPTARRAFLYSEAATARHA